MQTNYIQKKVIILTRNAMLTAGTRISLQGIPSMKGWCSSSVPPSCCVLVSVHACAVMKSTWSRSKYISKSLKLGTETELQQRQSGSCWSLRPNQARNSIHASPKTIRLGGPSDSWVMVWYVHFQMLDWQYVKCQSKSMVQPKNISRVSQGRGGSVSRALPCTFQPPQRISAQDFKKWCKVLYTGKIHKMCWGGRKEEKHIFWLKYPSNDLMDCR